MPQSQNLTDIYVSLIVSSTSKLSEKKYDEANLSMVVYSAQNRHILKSFINLLINGTVLFSSRNLYILDTSSQRHVPIIKSGMCVNEWAWWGVRRTMRKTLRYRVSLSFVTQTLRRYVWKTPSHTYSCVCQEICGSWFGLHMYTDAHVTDIANCFMNRVGLWS